jgi:hypothetical protein
MNRGTTTQLPTRGLWERVVVLFVLAAPVAVVQAEESSAFDTDARYRSTLKDALAEYDANHFEEARALFRRAHEINPNARTLRGIGMASFELRDYVAAVRTLSAALVETRKPLSAEQRIHAQGLLERSRMYVDICTLKISPADARVLIDGRTPDTESDGTVLLGFGSHNLEAGKPGFVLRTLVVNVRGGERKELAMTLERKATAVVRPGDPSVPEADQASPTHESVDRSRPEKVVRTSQGDGNSGAPWFFAASGAALLSAGAGSVWLIQNNELKSCHNPPANLRCDNESVITSRRNLAVGATLATGATAITLAVIGVLSRDTAGNTPSARSALSCAVSPSGFLCAKAF